MKLIVEYDEQKKNSLRQHTSRIEQLGKGFAALEINEKYLKWLSILIKGIEENSIIELEEQDNKLDSSLAEQDDIILAFIGHRQSNSLITHYYNMNANTMNQVNNNNKNNSFKSVIKRYCISCFSENNKIDTIGIIKCIRFLVSLSKELDKPLVIYASIERLHGKYNPKRLFYRIVNQNLEESKSILVIKPHQLNGSYRSIIEDTKGINSSIRKAISILSSFPNKLNTPINQSEKSKIGNRDNRQGAILYNDNFYQNIGSNEEIYVTLLAEASPNPQYYEDLGFQYISLESGQKILYGQKSNFDRHSLQLKAFLTSDYRVDILTHAPCIRDTTQKPMIPYFLPPESQKYTGKGVYIGIIAADDIDYTNSALRNPDGSTRIAYIWEQIRTTQGNAYTTEQINAALASPNPGEIIKLPSEESMSTVMAAISGGLDEKLRYRGIAPQAEFLVAKIQPVSENMQRIYGGMPNPKAIILQDALIGMFELGNFALKQGRPLVLIMPFNGNIDSHDAVRLLQIQLSILARRSGLTIIVPTGDEADKRHHFDIFGEQSGVRRVNIEVEQPNQNVIGVIFQWGANMQTATLYPPPGVTGSVELRRPGISSLGNATIYSSGERISALNGTLRTLFRIENPNTGEWYIETNVKMSNINKIELWLSQEELNPYVKLNPHKSLLTMGSTSAIENVISIGGYDSDTSTVISSSGRGDQYSLNVVPNFVTYGKSIVAPCTSGQWVPVSGTVPAASIMTGALAVMYQKFLELGESPLPNTVIMNSILTRYLTQFESLNYPNPSQGYGIFSLETLTQILNEIT